jgi:ABC-2 type transport system ATP-binding protein
MNAIEINGLSKSYDGKTLAVDGLNFTIPRGSIFGFLGPNGSGKTTTVRLANGILKPQKGTVSILGHDAMQDPIIIHSLCGVMTETASSYQHLSGFENLSFFARMNGLTGTALTNRCSTLLDLLDLSDVKNRKVKHYSSGMRKRISLAIAMVHSPKVIFLDEPTSGLDPENARNVMQMITRMATEEGVTVFVCTHQLKYAEELCSLFGFIDNGKLSGFGTMDELLAQKEDSVFLEIRAGDMPDEFAVYQKEDGLYLISLKSKGQKQNDAETAALISRITSKGAQLYEAIQKHLSLEDLYFAFTKKGGDV